MYNFRTLAFCSVDTLINVAGKSHSPKKCINLFQFVTTTKIYTHIYYEKKEENFTNYTKIK